MFSEFCRRDTSSMWVCARDRSREEYFDNSPGLTGQRCGLTLDALVTSRSLDCWLVLASSTLDTVQLLRFRLRLACCTEVTLVSVAYVGVNQISVLLLLRSQGVLPVVPNAARLLVDITRHAAAARSFAVIVLIAVATWTQVKGVC